MEVAKVQELLNSMGYEAGRVDGIFGPQTQAALNAYLKGYRQPPVTELNDEIIARLFVRQNQQNEAEAQDALAALTPQIVSKMCPFAPLENILTYLPAIKNALREQGLTDKPMVCAAIATVSAETGKFAPISEQVSRFNTDRGASPFNRYDDRKGLGNTGAPDGARYKGRGFIQLTGRDNYRFYGKKIDIDLENNPSQANDSVTAAILLALFLKDCAVKMRTALQKEDYNTARRLVNGGSYGLDIFTQAYKLGMKLLKE